MSFRISWLFVLAFIALNMFLGELHEQAHITTGYFICGCYGLRDFSVWSTCDNCANGGWSFLATLAGPVYTYIMMWLGAIWFARSTKRVKKAMGFSILFANLPFARLFTALTGGGDEKVVLQHLTGSDHSSIFPKIMAVLIVGLLAIPPIILVYRKLTNKMRGWIIAAFLVLPLIYGMLYHHMFLNYLLHEGLGSGTAILGSPSIIIIHTLLMLLIVLLFRKALFNAFILPGSVVIEQPSGSILQSVVTY
jgi:hypothetical protein